jgi:hypothetical protein
MIDTKYIDNVWVAAYNKMLNTGVEVETTKLWELLNDEPQLLSAAGATRAVALSRLARYAEELVNSGNVIAAEALRELQDIGAVKFLKFSFLESHQECICTDIYESHDRDAPVGIGSDRRECVEDLLKLAISKLEDDDDMELIIEICKNWLKQAVPDRAISTLIYDILMDEDTKSLKDFVEDFVLMASDALTHEELLELVQTYPAARKCTDRI